MVEEVEEEVDVVEEVKAKVEVKVHLLLLLIFYKPSQKTLLIIF